MARQRWSGTTDYERRAADSWTFPARSATMAGEEMPMSSPGDRSLFNLWRGGDEQAARELFERYADRLVALARRRLGQRMARRVDAEDRVQSVFRPFFARAKGGRFTIPGQGHLLTRQSRRTDI